MMIHVLIAASVSVASQVPCESAESPLQELQLRGEQFAKEFENRLAALEFLEIEGVAEFSKTTVENSRESLTLSFWTAMAHNRLRSVIRSEQFAAAITLEHGRVQEYFERFPFDGSKAGVRNGRVAAVIEYDAPNPDGTPEFVLAPDLSCNFGHLTSTWVGDESSMVRVWSNIIRTSSLSLTAWSGDRVIVASRSRSLNDGMHELHMEGYLYLDPETLVPRGSVVRFVSPDKTIEERVTRFTVIQAGPEPKGFEWRGPLQWPDERADVRGVRSKIEEPEAR